MNTLLSDSMTEISKATSAAIKPDIKYRRMAKGDKANVLTDIYLEDTNIAIWQRQLSASLMNSVITFINANPRFQAQMTVTPDSVLESITHSLGDDTQAELAQNIAALVDMFCCLFDLERTGLRLTVLDRAMCPKFHVDKVPCRLVTTFYGVATEWLPHQSVDRTKLGIGSEGKTDAASGLYNSPQDIQKLYPGEVALLKGESWEGNENAGLVHRSPSLPANQRRLLLTLDFSY